MKRSTDCKVSLIIVLVFGVLTVLATISDGQVIDTVTKVDTSSVKYALSEQYSVGDCNGSKEHDMDDITYLADYLFAGGPDPMLYTHLVEVRVKACTLLVYRNEWGDIYDYKVIFGNSWVVGRYLNEIKPDSTSETDSTGVK